jgi:hypothetical protein
MTLPVLTLFSYKKTGTGEYTVFFEGTDFGAGQDVVADVALGLPQWKPSEMMLSATYLAGMT